MFQTGSIPSNQIQDFKEFCEHFWKWKRLVVTQFEVVQKGESGFEFDVEGDTSGEP